MDRDREILRKLAARKAEIASLPVHKEKAKAWKELNDMRSKRPLVYITNIPWHEMNYDDELTLNCEDPFCRNVENQLRQEIYRWNHLPVDMVVEPVFYSPLVIHDSGFGIKEEDDRVIPQHSGGGIRSREFHPQINDEKDLEKIKTPVITYDEEATERNYQRLADIFGDILTVKKRGIVLGAFSPWDLLVACWGVQRALMDLIARPQLVHMAMQRLINCFCAKLDQWERLNLLSFAEGNYQTGSGGLAYTDELPKEGFNPDHVRPCDQWGYAANQIFTDVSPRMHEEFSLQYERRYLERFGMTYYGCCDALHNKIDILRSIPNLRKISVSPWADVEKTVERAGDDYVLSVKPTPAVFAKDDWNPKEAKKDLTKVVEKCQGCSFEIIMKDISTVRDEPQRLWEWARIAMDVVDQKAI